MGGWARLGVTLSVAVFALGCSSTSPRGSIGVQCELNTECETPLVCRLARCRFECATNRDCPIDSTCVKDARGLGACLLEDEGDCVLNSDCPEPLVCRDMRCGNVCAADVDCPAGSTCQMSETGGVCVDPERESCAVDSDCGGALVCARDRRCRRECRGDRDCRIGSRCADGVCEARPRDAGAPPMDGGPRDGGGGARDAGDGGGADDGGAAVSDGSSMGADTGAGSDAGSAPDTGVPDAGAPDAFVPECTMAADCSATRHVTGVDCVDFECVVTACDAPYDDCDGDFDNGCETDTTTHRDHCSACDSPCAVGVACLSSTCVDASIVDLAVASGPTANVYVTWSNGEVMSWGANSNGNLGRGDLDGLPRLVPGMVAGLTDAVAVAAGQSHACALRSTGELSCWGHSSAGQVGDGGTTGSAAEIGTPTGVVGLSAVTDFDARGSNSCAVHSGGAVSCWGANAVGQLGTGTSGTSSSTPLPVMGLTDAVQVVAGSTACALRATGELSCWGNNGTYNIGDGTTIDRAAPVPVIHSFPMAPVEVGYAGLVRLIDGRVVCWGSTACGVGHLETAAIDPVTVPVPTAQALTGGVLAADGTVWSWGVNRGQFGAGVWDTPLERATAAVGIDDAVLFESRSVRACIVRAAGELLCAGFSYTATGVEPTNVFLPVVGTP